MPRLLITATVSPMVQAFLWPFARHYRAQGWQVDVITRTVTEHTAWRDNFDHIYEIEWSRSLRCAARLPGLTRTIQHIAAQQHYDLVHVHTPVAAFMTRLALRKMRREGALKIIYTAHGFHFHENQSWVKDGFFIVLEKLAGRWTDRLVVMNQYDLETARRLRLLPQRDHIVYMPGIGIDTQVYSPDTVSDADVARIRDELQLDPDNPLFLKIAAFMPHKRHRDALVALQKLNRPNVHLALAGRGPLLEAMQQLAKELGIADRAHFLGFRADIPALLRASSAFIFCSEREGLPRSVMEALSMEVPVLGSDIRGTHDLVNEEIGRLYPLGDTSALADHMAWVLDHPNEARQMGQRGRAQMAQYSLDSIITLHDRLYGELLGELS